MVVKWIIGISRRALQNVSNDILIDMSNKIEGHSANRWLVDEGLSVKWR